MQHKKFNVAALLLALVVSTGAAPEAREKIYDESANPTQDIAAASEKAKPANKRILLMLGGNWCGWCHKLHGLFKQNKEVSDLLKGSYEVINVDIGLGDKNQNIVAKYGIKPNGYPYLAIIDPVEDKLVVQQETGALEEGDHHSPAKVITSLKANVATVK